VQSRPLESQSGGSSVGAADLAAGLAKDSKDVISFGGAKGGAFRFAIVEFILLRFQLSQRNVEGGSAGENDGSFEEVLQLADISGLLDIAFPMRRLCADTKWRTRIGISLIRSRNGGEDIGNTFRR
jgi:hypothetical protein